MLTGMGKDGAAAMLEMKQAGAYNFAQDEASCVVFGMPREAIALGAVDEIVPLPKMTERVLARLARQDKSKTFATENTEITEKAHLLLSVCALCSLIKPLATRLGCQKAAANVDRYVANGFR